METSVDARIKQGQRSMHAVSRCPLGPYYKRSFQSIQNCRCGDRASKCTKHQYEELCTNAAARGLVDSGLKRHVGDNNVHTARSHSGRSFRIWNRTTRSRVSCAKRIKAQAAGRTTTSMQKVESATLMRAKRIPPPCP